MGFLRVRISFKIMPGVRITGASQGTLRSGKGWRMRSERHSPHYTTSWQDLPDAKA